MEGGGGGCVKCGHADCTVLGGSSGKVLGEEDKMKRGLSTCFSQCPFMSSYLHEGLS